MACLELHQPPPPLLSSPRQEPAFKLGIEVSPALPTTLPPTSASYVLLCVVLAQFLSVGSRVGSVVFALGEDHRHTRYYSATLVANTMVEVGNPCSCASLPSLKRGRRHTPPPPPWKTTAHGRAPPRCARVLSAMGLIVVDSWRSLAICIHPCHPLPFTPPTLSIASRTLHCIAHFPLLTLHCTRSIPH
jgi:hypothetical protein